MTVLRSKHGRGPAALGAGGVARVRARHPDLVVVEGGHPTINALMSQPAVLSVPLAFATMVLVSLGDGRHRRPASAQMLALHAPEGLT